LYLHEFIAQEPTVFETCLGKLPQSVFMESIDMSKMPPPLSASASAKKKGKKSNVEAAEFNAIYKESVEVQREAAAFKKQEAALKALPKLSATVDTKRKLVKEEKQVLYDSVAAVEFDSDDDMPKNERKKRLRKAVDRRVERHCEKKKQREEDPDAMLSSQDTCATDISNFLQAQHDLAKAKALFDSTNLAASAAGHATEVVEEGEA
jgi:hypothetical protein